MRQSAFTAAELKGWLLEFPLVELRSALERIYAYETQPVEADTTAGETTAEDTAAAVDESKKKWRQDLTRLLDAAAAGVTDEDGWKDQCVDLLLNRKTDGYALIFLQGTSMGPEALHLEQTAFQLRQGNNSYRSLPLTYDGVPTVPYPRILLLGSKKATLGLHTEDADAANLLFAVSLPGLTDGQALSLRCTWYCISPKAADEAMHWIWKELKRDKTIVTDAECQSLRNFLGKDFKGNWHVERLEQAPGDLVHVPPGWAHAVMNSGPCMNLAWGFHVPQHIPDYVRHWLHIAPVFPIPGQDSLCIENFLCVAALAFARGDESFSYWGAAAGQLQQ
jgi:hypothetical protein